MKVLQLVQKPQLRGAEIFASQLSKNLMELGVEVHLISIFQGNADLPFKGKTSHLKRPIGKRFLDFKAWKLLAEIINDEKPDLIQANAGDTLKIAIFSKLLYQWRVPIVFRNANKMGDFIDSWYKYYFNKFLVSRVDLVISVSQLCRNDFINTFNYPSKKVFTIPIGVEEQKFLNSPPVDLISIFNNYKVLVNVGSLVPEKNHQALLRIFNEVAVKDERLYLIIIGDGPLRRRLEEQAMTLSCRNRVLFLGYRNDVLQIMKYSQAFLLPSLIEGLPGVVLEAMYSHTPVIANNVGGISEVVNEQTGWLIEKGDEKKFTSALIDLLDDTKTTKMKVQNAYKHIIMHYLNSKIALNFKEIYSSKVITQ